MNAEKSIEYLCSADWHATRFGLHRTRHLLSSVGNPELSLKFVHIAGTNGKGSTASMIASVLHEAGYKTGLFTSPHIQKFNERIQVNGEHISDADISRITGLLKPVADAMEDHPTEFEMVTVLGLLYFQEQNCDIVVLEVGMGGELDSTNSIPDPVVSVITAIGLDHTEYLGDTVEEIARTKAGIVKANGECVVYDQTQSVLTEIEKVCLQRNAKLTVVDFSEINLKNSSLSGQIFDYGSLHYIHFPLLGEYQLKNAAVAITALRVIAKKGFKVSQDDIKNGIAKTKWPVRFEVLNQKPLFIADGGHNPQCVESLVKNIKDYLPDREIIFLVGVLADKDYDSMIKRVFFCAKEFITVTPDSERALSADILARHLSYLGKQVIAAPSVKDGVKTALEHAGEFGTVISFGSLYMSGEIRDYFNL